MIPVFTLEFYINCTTFANALTSTIRQINTPFRIGSCGSRGLRVMISGSFGSRESAVPSTATLTMLIHRIWIGWIG